MRRAKLSGTVPSKTRERETLKKQKDGEKRYVTASRNPGKTDIAQLSKR